MSLAQPLLSVEGLSKSYGGVHAVRGVSFALASGEILALIGPNGAGKSTCFDMLNGQTTPDAGRVYLQGTDVVGLKPREVWRLGVGRTFQITATFATMTVRQNVQVALGSRDTRRTRPIACSTSSGWRVLRSAPVVNSPMAISSGWSLRLRSPISRNCC
jgi:branched-chain amino acid transport system ATP-binding protein